MNLQAWADDVIARFPTATTSAERDEWYGVENGVDVLMLANEAKKVLAQKEELKKKVAQLEAEKETRQVNDGKRDDEQKLYNLCAQLRLYVQQQYD